MMEGSGEKMFHLQVVDYVILALIIPISAGSGLYVSLVRHKQTSIVEYFLAGRNARTLLIQLSYFSSFAAGGMMGMAIEIYTFGSQSILGILISTPLALLWLHYLIVPVFYKMQNISMLKYFSVRFGSIVSTIATVAIICLMLVIGTVNVYVASITIHQVSDLSFWVAAAIMTSFCVVYSSLGGMRGIVLADSIQAVVMIIAVLSIFIMGIVKNDSLSAIWSTNSQHGRLLLADWRLDPTLRYTIWTSLFGYHVMHVAFVLSNQTLLQRCVMAPNLKTARRIALIGTSMTHVYILVLQCLGLIIFAYYKGCNLVQSGTIKTFNQLLPYFAMETLHGIPGLAGLFFSGVLCATLSTVSSLLNSISAIIMSPIMHKSIIKSDKLGTLFCKVLVLLFGGLMTIGLVVIDYFSNFNQAVITLMSAISGPTFALYCLGTLCPQAKNKSVAIAYITALLFGLYMLIGTVLTSFKDQPLPFATCNSTMVNVTMSTPSNLYLSVDTYFPLARVSYIYMCLEGFLVTVVCFILLTFVLGPRKLVGHEVNMDLIPLCIQRLQLKMGVRLRRFLLCDVYFENREQQLMEKLQPVENC